MESLETAFHRTRSQRSPSLHRPGDALQFLRPEFLKLEQIAEKSSRAFGNDNRVRLSDTLQPCSEVRRLANDPKSLIYFLGLSIGRCSFMRLRNLSMSVFKRRSNKNGCLLGRAGRVGVAPLPLVTNQPLASHCTARACGSGSLAHGARWDIMLVRLGQSSGHGNRKQRYRESLQHFSLPLRD